MQLTRRDATKLVLTGTALAAAPWPAMAASNGELAARLENRLNAALTCKARFKVAAFGQGKAQGKRRMAAVVELTWEPGFRRRRFDAFGADDTATFASLENLAMSEFATTGCVA